LILLLLLAIAPAKNHFNQSSVQHLPSRTGAVTTVKEARNATEQWEQPILPAKNIEAGCGQCHLEKPTATPFLRQGRTMSSRAMAARMPHHQPA